QKVMLLHRPDLFSVLATRALSAGARQTIPADGSKLLEVVRNTSGGRPITLVKDRRLLDVVSPTWYSMTGVTEIKHYMHDERDADAFWVYPPAASSGASVDLLYVQNPTDVAVPADGTTVDDVMGDLSVPDFIAPAVDEWVLFRAYLQDSEAASPNAQRAMVHARSFADLLGVELNGLLASAPRSAGRAMSPAAQ
ncbi:MAG TPA: hypothetical protein PLV68_07490, partial [Ilumatobacteraceae bacterium]|nr:hypothetical protein [Ilumatobacteraceae bacterium]